MHLYFVIYLYTHYHDVLFYSAPLEQRILENTGLSVMILAGTELIFFLAAGTVLCLLDIV